MTPITTLIDYILDLFRSPQAAAAFVTDPAGSMRDAGLPNVSAAQLQAVAASAAPAGLALGGGDPVVGLQRAVADHHQIMHNFASPLSPQTYFAPQPTFAPETNTDLASHNNTDLASHNSTDLASHNATNAEFMSPDQGAGANSQVGGFNLGFGDITLGDKSTNTATEGGVVVDGENTGAVTTGDDNVVGDGNEVIRDIDTGDGSPVTIGTGNEVDATSQNALGDIVQDNEGPIIKDVDMSGGNSAGGTGHGGGLLGIGTGIGGDSAGGSAGSIIIDTSKTTDVGGNQTSTVSGGDLGGVIDASDNTAQDNSVDDSVHTAIDNSAQDNSVDDSVHTAVDNSGQDNSVDNSDTHTVDVSSEVDAGLF